MSWLKNFSKKKGVDIYNKYYQIREDSFFLDEQKHRHYLKYGWCTIPNIVTQKEIDSFVEVFDEISQLEGFQMGELFLNSGRLHNPEIRKKTQSIINKNAQTILPRMFDMDKTDTHTGGAFQIKPPHENSTLQIHQDSSVIDEENEYCLFVWIPFCDITMENGVVSFVNGSHLWGNTQRSLGVPWQFLNHLDTLYNHITPVTLKKGDVLIFDPATLHASAPNLSSSIRQAITITVLKKNYQLVYYFKNPEVEDGYIEKYYIDESFYYTYDFVSKPDETKWRKEIVPLKPFDISKNELLSLIHQHFSSKS
jgi:hypothetical protein